MHFLLDPLQFGFVRHALVVCAFAGALCGLLGIFVTLRGMSYIGQASATPSSAGRPSAPR